MMRVSALLLLLLIVGCSKVEMAKMSKKTGEDAVTVVRSYQQASIPEVEGVVKSYLALADDYERRGWGRYGSPGWIEELRGLCEARLAVFNEALGKAESYRTHMDRALAHFKKSNPEVDYTEAGVREGVERLDAANIQPNWRKELQVGATNGKTFRLETNRASSAVGPLH